MRETASVRRQAPRNVASILDSAREFGIRDAQESLHPWRRPGTKRIPTNDRASGMPIAYDDLGQAGDHVAGIAMACLADG